MGYPLVTSENKATAGSVIVLERYDTVRIMGSIQGRYENCHGSAEGVALN